MKLSISYQSKKIIIMIMTLVIKTTTTTTDWQNGCQIECLYYMKQERGKCIHFYAHVSIIQQHRFIFSSIFFVYSCI